jgi:type II secretory pathway pseudopilin PulG
MIRGALSDSLSARRGERGYNLVILVVALAVLNILLAAALPAWSTAIRREKEEELIFRGLQYAEAIRRFKFLFGAAPTRLEDLLKSEPRCIRQLWKDPMTEDGKWMLIFEGQGVPLEGNLEGDEGQQQGGGAGFNPQGGGGLDIPTEGLPGQGEVVAVGPIKGVRSRSSETSILKFTEQERYDRWYFTTDLLVGGGRVVQAGAGAGVPNVGGGVGIVLSTRWVGRPWPRELSSLLNGVPQQQAFPPGADPNGRKPPRGNAIRPDPNRPPVIPGRDQ